MKEGFLRGLSGFFKILGGEVLGKRKLSSKKVRS